MESTEIAYLVARVLTCGIWVSAGLYKAMHFDHTVAEMQGHGIPLANLLLPVVILLEMVGSALMVLDGWVWAVSIAWLAFMIPASYLYHLRFMIKDGAIDFIQFLLFWKNVSIAGGLIALILLDDTRPVWLWIE